MAGDREDIPIMGKVIEYSSKDLSQEELTALVPSRIKEVPACFRCKKNPRRERANPRPDRRGVSAEYHTYCIECKRAMNREAELKRKKTMDPKFAGQIDETMDPKFAGQICPLCQTRKRDRDRRFCDECYRANPLTHQPAAWDQVAFKLEELIKYVSDNVEFPPEFTVNTRSRIRDALKTLKLYLKEIEEE